MRRTLLVVSIWIAGCDSQSIGVARENIAGGELDTERRAIVGIRIDYDGYAGLCTGTLVTDDLVVLARHCLAPVIPGFITCGEEKFGEPYPAAATRVTSDPNVLDPSARFRTATDVWVPTTNDACGVDIAVVALEPTGEPVATIEPRSDRVVEIDETYTAVGYGSVEGPGITEPGQRRARGDLRVECADESCGGGAFVASEWRGETGTCVGDSGGPALDADGKLIGVLSRSNARCDGPIYASLVSFAPWLNDIAIAHADRRGVAPPSWALPKSVEPDAAVPAEEDEATVLDAGAVPPRVEGGCSATPRKSSAWLLCAAMLASFGFRRSRRKAQRGPR